MSNQGYSTSFTVDKSPDEAFNAINDVRGWWSEEIEGNTDRLGAEFKYHYKDVHRCEFRITEFVPGEKVVWHVLDNYFDFVKDKTEWVGTDVIFEIAGKGDKTEVRFTHAGLVREYECYDICSNAWGGYIKESLRDLITTGKGRPNPKEESAGTAGHMKDYTTSFLVDQTPGEVFAAINNVRGWWSGEIAGETVKPGAEFTYRVPNVHFCRQKITEFVPDRKVVWHVLDANISFVENTGEWKDTDIIFEIAGKGDKTEVRFTHKGLVPAFQCYKDCSNGWNVLVNGNLRKLIETGKDQPSPW